ncbi:MAG: hypothetical protein RBS14_00995 [Atribacterota bacterium]|jgi:hypothetical protein|nr:hypothetical protein [Atribacterota bacterium]
MKKPQQPTVLATFRLANNVLTHIDGNVYRIDREQAKNIDLDSISTQVINLINSYLDEYYLQNNIVVSFDSIVSTENCADVPLNTLILAESESSKGISENIKNELCLVVTKFIEDVLTNRGDIFATNNPGEKDIFTPDKSDFINEYSKRFISKYKGKSISKPFLCVISGEKTTNIPVQGTFKSPVPKSPDDKDDEIFFAHSDGSKGSGMLIFLKRVGTTNKLISGPSREFIAEKDSHTKIAAAALASASPLVKVVSYEKTDAKGKTLFYIKDISQASIEELGGFELELTD